MVSNILMLLCTGSHMLVIYQMSPHRDVGSWARYIWWWWTFHFYHPPWYYCLSITSSSSIWPRTCFKDSFIYWHTWYIYQVLCQQIHWSPCIQDCFLIHYFDSVFCLVDLHTYPCTWKCLLSNVLFFLNQQFITQCSHAVHGYIIQIVLHNKGGTWHVRVAYQKMAEGLVRSASKVHDQTTEVSSTKHSLHSTVLIHHKPPLKRKLVRMECLHCRPNPHP